MKLQLYCITCKRTDISYEEQVEQACKGGADAIQFRDKTLSAREILETGKKLKEICQENKVLFLLNDRPDLALALDADGIHLGADDVPLFWARQILGGRKIIGCTVSSLGQALAAAKEGVQYLAVGPVYRPADKHRKEEQSIDLVRMVKERVKVPVIATGGITPENVEEVMRAGADGVAATRSLCGARLITQSVAEMKQKIVNIIGQRVQEKNYDNF